jgi:hypothetical protein
MGIEAIPQRLRDIHDLSDHHREAVMASTQCGCFCCRKFFSPTEIKEWIRDEGTAMCPRCGIDAVLGDKSIALTPALLLEMQEAWFGVKHDIVVDIGSTFGPVEEEGPHHGSECAPDCPGCTCPKLGAGIANMCRHCLNITADESGIWDVTTGDGLD